MVPDGPVPLQTALGIWITRGGWHGYEHAALEPTNAASDSLAEAATKVTSAHILPPEGEKAWMIRLCLEPLRPADS
jgi:hypothetical protein